MIKKQQQFILKGMNQDIAETKVQPELAHSIKNLRVITDEDSGTLSLVTEKGTQLKDLTISIDTYLSFSISHSEASTYTQSDFLNSDYNINDIAQYITFFYNYAIGWYSVTLTAKTQACWDYIYTLGRSNFLSCVDVKGTLVNTTLPQGRYTVNAVSPSSPNLIVTVYDSSNTVKGFFTIEPDSTTYNSVVKDADKWTLTFNVPIIDFRWAINNYVNKTNPFYYADAILYSKIESDISSIEEYLGTQLYTFTLKTILGDTIIDKDLYLFGIAKYSSGNQDCIVEIKNFNDTPTVNFLYLGNLNFDLEHPIKTYVSVESEEQKRIYWIDGINQPRVINVSKTYEFDDNNTDNHFEFCSQLPTNQNVTITKNNFGGTFHSGVIQYFFTYVDKNEQESKIFYQSPLYYITQEDRGASPEEMCTCSFDIKITNINNSNWLRKQIRCYAIQRTSLDAEVTAKVVSVLSLKDEDTTVSFTDTGQIGYSINASILFALGCEEFVPQTFAVKNNTMFFGNVHIKDVTSRDNFPDLTGLVEIDTNKRICTHIANTTKSFQLSDTSVNNGTDQGIKGFMFQEEYMLGLQFLHKNGSWSEPIWVEDKIMTQSPFTNGGYYYIPYFKKTISSNIVSDLVNRGYIQVRPLVVCNDYANARVLCNGILNPTVKYTNNNIVQYLSSWFFRPNLYSGLSGRNQLADSVLNFRFIANGDTVSGTCDTYLKNEIQGVNTEFEISQLYVTFNSPEIEFEKITNVPNNFKLLYSGCFDIHGNKYDIDIRTSTVPQKTDGGFKHVGGQIDYRSDPNNPQGTSVDVNAGQTFLGGKCWYDSYQYSSQNTENGYVQTDPWENNTSYTGWPKTEDIVYAAPESKTITNWRINQYCNYVSNSSIDSNYYDSIDAIKLANDSFIQLNVGDQYCKDVDILFLPSSSYTIRTTGSNNISNVDYPIRIQYKSTPHLLLKLNRQHLPKFNTIYDGSGSNPYNFSQGYTNSGNSAVSINRKDSSCYANLLQGTLINKAYDSNASNHFGGRNNGVPTDNSLNNSKWLVAGGAKKLSSGNVVVSWTSGDTYYQRYNCLKTYPYSHESKNNIIEIASVMIQTRVNIDGTYDAQKNDILHIEPANFNLLNDIYSQEDNFFTFRNITTKTYDSFKNTIFWTSKKSFGNEIDTWCNVRLGNSTDLNGNNGNITAIVNWNDNLLVFQDRAIHKLNYNENTVLSGQNGIPVVLQGSDRVTGATLVSGQFGCQNQWSIVNAKSGLYFSDDYNHKIYVLSDGINCISDSFGFKSYLKNKNYTNTWKPDSDSGSTLRSYYDQQLGDIYFTDGIDCLAYNENVKLFTAFYDYCNGIYKTVVSPTGNPHAKGYYEYVNNTYTLTEDTTVNNSKTYYTYVNAKLFDFVNIENKNYWILNDFTNNIPLFYKYRVIDNLNIFDNNRNYEIELTANVDPHLDKIFDTVEIRGDSYNTSTNPDTLNSGYGSIPPFDRMRVTNEYQDTNPSDTNNLTFSKDIPSNVKQKFRIWRAQIGRNQKNNQNTRDRIRNYWSRIKLTKNGVTNLRAKIHDIVVDVYE